MEYLRKVIDSSVLANRNVNITENSLVTKPSLTFSNKLERPQKSQISSFFPVSSNCKSESFSPAGNSSSWCQTPSEKSDGKASPAPNKPDSPACSSRIDSSSLNASGFPIDDWDDLDDFETSVRIKNDSFSSDKSVKITKVSSSDEELPNITGKQDPDTCLEISELSNWNNAQMCVETDKVEKNVDKKTVSPGPDVFEDSAKIEVEDSPVKRSRRRCPPLLVTSVLSDSDDDTVDLSKPLEDKKSKRLSGLFCFELIFLPLQICISKIEHYVPLLYSFSFYSRFVLQTRFY